MKALLRVIALSLCALSVLHANSSRQSSPNFHYMRALSKTDFVSSGGTTLVKTFTISNPGTYTLAQDIGYQAHNNSTAPGESCAIYINSSDVVLDLGSFTLYSNSNVAEDSATKAIDINTHKDNIIIKNGNINGFSETGVNIRSSSRSIHLQDIAINACGVYGISCVGAAGIENINAGILIQNCRVTDTTRTNNMGVRITFTENIIMQDTSVGFGNNDTAGSESIGILFSTCTNIQCNNVSSGGHYGDGAFGYKLTDVRGGIFENCVSQGNYAIDSTSTETCVGFFVETSTAVQLKNCKSYGHAAKREAQGFFYGNAIGCLTEGCTANGIRMENLDASDPEHPLFAGFFSLNGFSNTWKNCISESNYAGNASTTDGDGAIGFYLSSEAQSALISCKSRGHGSIYNHAANAIGIYLDDTRRYKVTDGNFMKKEDCQFCQVTSCEASSNCTSASTGVAGTKGTYTAYGIRDDSANTKNIIIKCFAFGNSDSASPRVVTNYYMDLTVGATTPANWPRIETNMDGLIDLANTPDFYNVSITS